MGKFKVGEIVTLSPNSKWAGDGTDPANPLQTVGTIYEIWRDGTYNIDWSNGVRNGCYTDDCLLPCSNCVTVSSLDYMDSKDLDQADKEVIRNFLEKSYG